MKYSKVPPLIVIGASLGGLDALCPILRGLPAELPAAIAVVQHRKEEPGPRLLDHLASASRMPVVEPDDAEQLMKGRIYLAPAGYHLLIDGGRFSLSTEAPVLHARPSIDVLFESAAASHGASLASVLLTGASQDGAAGSQAVHRVGGTTIVQSPATAESAIAPSSAIALHAPTHVARIEEIPGLLCAWCLPGAA